MEEEVPENGYDVSAFFDTECRQGEREPEDEPVEESLGELLCFFISSADKRTGTTNPIYVLFRTRLTRNEFPRRQYSGRILRMAVQDATCQLYGHGQWRSKLNNWGGTYSYIHVLHS